MDRQRVFDDMVKGLRSQGYKRALNEWGSCLYRAKDMDVDQTVLKCAVGWLIPDDAYHPGVDTHGGAGEMLKREPDIRAAIEAKYGEVATGDVQFLAGAQVALHDNAKASKDDMEFRFKVFAQAYGLCYDGGPR